MDLTRRLLYTILRSVTPHRLPNYLTYTSRKTRHQGEANEIWTDSIKPTSKIGYHTRSERRRNGRRLVDNEHTTHCCLQSFPWVAKLRRSCLGNHWYSYTNIIKTYIVPRYDWAESDPQHTQFFHSTLMKSFIFIFHFLWPNSWQTHRTRNFCWRFISFTNRLPALTSYLFTGNFKRHVVKANNDTAVNAVTLLKSQCRKPLIWVLNSR